MNKATFVRKLKGWTGDARLYKCDPPMNDNEGKPLEYVVVSATSVLGTPETYIFPADAEGEVLDFGELAGSFRGGWDHDEALKDAGYES